MPLPRSQEFDNLESYPRKFSVDRDEFQFMVKHYPDVDNSLRNCRRRMSDLKVDLVFEDSNSKKAAEEIIKKHLHTIRTRCGTDEVLLSTHVSLFEIDTAVAEFAKAHSLLHIRRRERTQSVIVMGEEITFVKWAKQQLAEKLPPNSCLMNNFKIEHFKYYYLIENLRWNLDMFWPRDVYSVNTTPIDEWMEIEVTSPSRTNGEITESINKCQTSIEEIFRNVHMTVLSDIISASSWFPFLAPVLTQVRVYVRWVPEFSPKMYLMATKRDDVQLIKEYCVFLMEQTKSEQPHQDDDMVGIYGDKITVCLTMGDISIFHCDAILIPFCHQSSQNQVSRKVEKAGGRTYQRLIASSKVDSGGTVYFVPLPALGKLQCKRVYNLCEPDWSTWQPGQHILHDGILPALADCTKHNYKQIAIAPIVSG